MTVSVALCTYNGEKFIASQLESILSQTVSVNEIVICDDCSSDDTLKIIMKFSRENHGIIKLHKNEKNIGGRRNFEQALSLCTGDIIFLSDQDDIWLENKAERVLSVFNQHPSCKGIFSNGFLINANNNVLSKTLLDHTFFSQTFRNCHTNSDLLYWSIILGNIITGATLALRKEALHKVLPLKLQENLWHDAWIGFKLLSESSIQYLDECLIQYRLHENQQVGVSPFVESSFTNFILKRKRPQSGQEIKQVFLSYLNGFLFLRKLKNATALSASIEQRIVNEYIEIRKIYFDSQPFVEKKLRLVKWYLMRKNNISLKDLFDI